MPFGLWTQQYFPVLEANVAFMTAKGLYSIASTKFLLARAASRACRVRVSRGTAAGTGPCSIRVYVSYRDLDSRSDILAQTSYQ